MRFNTYKKNLKCEYETSYKKKPKKYKKVFLKVGISFVSIFALFALILFIDTWYVSDFNKKYDEFHNNRDPNLVEIDNNELINIIDTSEKYKVRKDYLLNRIASIFESTKDGEMGNDVMNGTFQDEVTAETTIPQVSDSQIDTNVQVKGIDEADVAKCDGEFIYYTYDSNLVAYNISRNTFINTKFLNTSNNYSGVYFSNDMAETRADNAIHSQAKEIYVYDNKIAVITKKAIYIYSLEDDTLKAEEKVEFNNYVNSRLINNNLYIVSNLSTYRNVLYDELARYDNIYYDSLQINYVTSLISVNLDDMSMKKTALITGYSTILYTSNNNFYLASSAKNKTNIFIFDYNLKSKGFISINGRVKDQFAMDEYNGYFRVASSYQVIGDPSYYTSKLEIFNLENNECISKVDNIGLIGQEIKSVRYSGDTCYIVTYENTDPLYEINLEDVYNPYIVSSYMAPGYSSYLHEFKINDKTYVYGLGYTDLTEEGYRDFKISLYEKTEDGSSQIGSDFIISFYNDKADYKMKTINYTLFSNHKSFFNYKQNDSFYFGTKVDAETYLIIKFTPDDDNAISIYKEINMNGDDYIPSRCFLINGKLYITKASLNDIIIEEF